jgi:hypothetical protein
MSGDFEERIAAKKLQQRKGELLEELEKTGTGIANSEPTEYAKSARFIVEKNQSPEDLQEQIYQSNIPKTILPNIMMLHGINKSIENLYTSDAEEISKDGKHITLYRESNIVDPVTQKNVMLKYRTMSMKGYNETKYWDEFWHQMQAGLMLSLPAVDGGVRKDGVTMVSSITNSDRALLEAQNNSQAGLIRRGWNKVFGK